ncbi:MAG: Ribosomal RNA large subunit methyltransferase K/L [Bacteroidia bacterium]|nr:Ribosomal RNA large subunit methyltransferase K/L [Bacteroidia bacterium]
MLLLSPQNFNDYELIDVGNFEKLERFGQYITIRPEPQAVWQPKLSYREWEQKAHIKFVAKSSSSGNWNKLKNSPDRWNIQYRNLKFRLALTSFKHVGIFPEQAVNWDYITESTGALNLNEPKFLNLFAYTGAASIAAKAAGADVTHVDSIKQVVTWANENMQHSNLDNIRWVVEDAMKFVKREVKRGKKYHGIILDPPAYGHGPNGESWKLEDNIDEMLKNVLQLLDEEKHFLILNTYSLGFSSMIIENLIYNNLPYKPDLETGELYLQATTGNKLPLGVFGRFRKT